jgi:hypothetical protein
MTQVHAKMHPKTQMASQNTINVYEFVKNAGKQITKRCIIRAEGQTAT